MASFKETCKSYEVIKLYLIPPSVCFLKVCWILIVKRSYGLWMKDSFSSQATVSTALYSLIFHCLQDDGMYIGFFFQVSYQQCFGTFGQKNLCLLSRVSFSNVWCKSILYGGTVIVIQKVCQNTLLQKGLYLVSFPSLFLATVYRSFP